FDLPPRLASPYRLTTTAFLFLFTFRHPQRSTLFPYTTLFRSQPTRGGATDAFVTKVAAAGSSLAYSTYLAGAAEVRGVRQAGARSEEHTSELQSLTNIVCRLLLEKKNNKPPNPPHTYSRPAPR